MYTPDENSWPIHGRDRSECVLPLASADPAAVIQRALGGFPAPEASAEQIVLTWLMTLPRELDPPRAARSLLAARMPCCRSAQPSGVSEIRHLLRYIASHHKSRTR
jgi:hypothetical protein